MSQNAFNIDPIFLLPIDSDENLKESKENKSNNIYIQSKENNSSNNSTDSNSSFISELKINEANDDEKSNINNNKKIYFLQYLKDNWILRCRRLKSKIKKKLIKEYLNSCKEEFSNINNNDNNIDNEYLKVNKNNQNYINNFYNSIGNSTYFSNLMYMKYNNNINVNKSSY